MAAQAHAVCRILVAKVAQQMCQSCPNAAGTQREKSHKCTYEGMGKGNAVCIGVRGQGRSHFVHLSVQSCAV